MFFQTTGTDPNTNPAQAGESLESIAGKSLLFKKNWESLFSETIKTATGLQEALANIDATATLLNRTFGQGKERLGEMYDIASKIIPEITALGGSASDAAKTLTEISEATRKNYIATTEETTKLFSASKLIGVTAKDITNNFLDAGVQASQIGKNLEEGFNYVRSVGGNARQVMAEVEKNVSKINQYNFADGVLGLTRMASQASLLRFDMAETFKFADKVMKPEGAIETAAALQRLGVAAGDLTDPFALMNKSLMDPEGLQKSLINLTKQYTFFDEKTKTFKFNPEGMLMVKELSDATGITEENLRKSALAAQDLDKRLSEVSPEINWANEEDKQYLMNIAQMDEMGQYTVRIRDDRPKEERDPSGFRTVALQELNQKQMDDLIAEQKRGPKTLEEQQKQMLSYSEDIAADLKGIAAAVSNGIVSVREVRDRTIGAQSKTAKTLDAAKSAFTTKDARTMVEKSGADLKDAIKDLLEGKSIDISKIAGPNGLIDAFNAASNRYEQALQKMPKDTKEEEIAGEDYKALTNQIEKLANILMDPTKRAGVLQNMERAQEGNNAAKEFLRRMFNVDDFIITKEKIIKTDPKDIIVGMKPQGAVEQFTNQKRQTDQKNSREISYHEDLNLISNKLTDISTKIISKQNLEVKVSLPESFREIKETIGNAMGSVGKKQYSNIDRKDRLDINLKQDDEFLKNLNKLTDNLISKMSVNSERKLTNFEDKTENNLETIKNLIYENITKPTIDLLSKYGKTEDNKVKVSDNSGKLIVDLNNMVEELKKVIKSPTTEIERFVNNFNRLRENKLETNEKEKNTEGFEERVSSSIHKPLIEILGEVKNINTKKSDTQNIVEYKKDYNTEDTTVFNTMNKSIIEILTEIRKENGQNTKEEKNFVDLKLPNIDNALSTYVNKPLNDILEELKKPKIEKIQEQSTTNRSIPTVPIEELRTLISKIIDLKPNAPTTEKITPQAIQTPSDLSNKITNYNYNNNNIINSNQNLNVGGQITVKVDISGAQNLNPEQLRKIFDENFNSTDFKQHVRSLVKESEPTKAPVKESFNG